MLSIKLNITAELKHHIRTVISYALHVTSHNKQCHQNTRNNFVGHMTEQKL